MCLEQPAATRRAAFEKAARIWGAISCAYGTLKYLFDNYDKDETIFLSDIVQADIQYTLPKIVEALDTFTGPNQVLDKAYMRVIDGDCKETVKEHVLLQKLATPKVNADYLSNIYCTYRITCVTEKQKYDKPAIFA